MSTSTCTRAGSAPTPEALSEGLFEAILDGDRRRARDCVRAIREAGFPPRGLLVEMLWPMVEMLRARYRDDEVSTLIHQRATRLVRMLVDQLQTSLPVEERRERSVTICCGTAELDEIAASMAAHLVEAAGYEVRFFGGSIPRDEIRAEIGETRPDILLLWSSAASDLPEIRSLLDELHESDLCPSMQIAVGGGVFARADGLADEIGADLHIPDLGDVVDMLVECPEQRMTPEQRTVGAKRQGRRAA